jgi:hypothetical protein
MQSASSHSPSTRRRAASSCTSSSSTTDGIRDLPGNNDPTGHHSHGTTTPIPDQRKRVDHVQKDNSFLLKTAEPALRRSGDERGELPTVHQQRGPLRPLAVPYDHRLGIDDAALDALRPRVAVRGLPPRHGEGGRVANRVHSAGSVAGVRLATGIHQTDAFAVANLLVVHWPPRLAHETDESIREGMRSFAAAMHLGPHDNEPPYIGHRIRIRRGMPWLDYGDDEYRLRVPAAQSWVDVAAHGGPIRVLVLFDPLAPGANQHQTTEHLRDCSQRGAMRWGTTYHI